MIGKQIELNVRKMTEIESAIADGYVNKTVVDLKGLYDELTISVKIEGEPKVINKALKSLNIKKLEKKCAITFSEWDNPQTSLDEHLPNDEDE